MNFRCEKKQWVQITLVVLPDYLEGEFQQLLHVCEYWRINFSTETRVWEWTLKTETYNWKGNGVGFLWLIKIAKCYNISFALYSNDDIGKCSEICLWFYFGMNCYFSLDGLFATQAQDHDGTRELHESLSNRIVLCGLSPACLWL